MTSCPNSHDDAWDLNCPQCLARIDYGEACRGLLKLPEASVSFEMAEAVFAATPKTPATNAFTCELATGPEKHEGVDTLTLKEIEGGTWRDYLEEDETLRKWLRRISIGRSRHKLLIMDTTKPISVLAAGNASIDRDTTVVAITADDTSTPMERNTSYAALKTIHGRKLPTILVTSSYAENLAAFSESSGLSRGRRALNQIITGYINQIRTISSFIERDRKIGIEAHALSMLISANEIVYRDVDAAIETQRQLGSTPYDEEDVLSIRLLAVSHWERFNKIERAYRRFRSRYTNLIDSEISLSEADTRQRLYDIHILYGLRRDPVIPLLREGYEAVAKRIPSLRWEDHR